MPRTLSSTMTTAQAGTNKTPYIHVEINSNDYSSRLLSCEWIEEPYRDRGTFVFRNDDRYFDASPHNDLIGRSFQPGWGYTTGAGNEYCGDGTNEYTPTIWVKNQEIISFPGMVVCQLYCEGMWMKLRESAVTSLGLITQEEPGYEGIYDGSSHTIYDIMEDLIETAMGWTLEPYAYDEDGIINNLKPVFTVNTGEYEMAAYTLRRLLEMTKCYIRQTEGTTWELVYPQTSDAANQTYYSSSADGHPFFEYMERISEVIPNRIVVFGNNPTGDEDWPDLLYGDTGAPTTNYGEVMQYYLAPTLTSQDDLDLRASAILQRYKAEGLAGRLIVPHDCSVELYDRVQVKDGRGAY